MRNLRPVRRWLSLLCCVALLCSLVPSALAADGALSIEMPAEAAVDVNNTYRLQPTVRDPQGKALTSGVNYTYTSSDNAVATVTGTGTVSGVSKGTADITVTATYRVSADTELRGTAVTHLTVNPRIRSFAISAQSIMMDLGDTNKSVSVTVTTEGGSADVVWSSSNPEIAEVVSLDQNGWIGSITPKKPGTTTITAAIGNAQRKCEVTVSGMYLDTTSITLAENESKTLPKYFQFGAAAGSVSWQSGDPTIVQVSGTNLVGRSPGTTTVTARSGTYESICQVTVTTNTAFTITTSVTGLNPLRFSTLTSQLNDQARNQTQPDSRNLDYLTSLRVDTDVGTLYYNYRSEAEPGEGVAQNGQYYLNPGAGQKGISDISFVANPYYTGSQAVITYTGVAGNTRFDGKIQVSIQHLNNNIALTTTVNTPIKLSGASFNEICQRATGAPLDYVTFSLPAENRGVLYSNYFNAENYGGKVTSVAMYKQSDLNDITFVPAPGFTGSVTMYYTGRSVGSSNNRYNGQITITVTQDSAGGPSYSVSRNGRVTFDDEDFNDYCTKVQSTSETLNYIRFDALPDESQGVLYYGWTSASKPGSRIYAGDSYYYGSRTPRLDRITFVAGEDFSGRISIPFTGWDRSGNQFSGTVDINVRSGGGSGDIHYTCAPGRTVRFKVEDFRDLCQDLLDDNLNYIVFDTLPSRSDGTVYNNNNRVFVGTRYYRSSTPYITNLTFEAESRFSGQIELTFTGHATHGDTFTGVITIESSSSGSSGSYQDVVYTTDYQTAVRFDDDDFDDLCRYETDSRLNYVIFTLPSSSQGTLYLNYRDSASSNTKVNANTRYYRNSSPRLDQVYFLPASGFTGTCNIEFTGYAQDSTRFYGTVSIDVTAPRPDVNVFYSTRTQPVPFRSSDFSSSGNRLSTVRFDAMPPASAGYLYYQYTSATQYGRQASVGTSYSVSDSSGGNLLSQLTYVPRAGYQGSFTMPFTATTSANRTLTGEVVISVDGAATSLYFNDLAGYSNQARAAADYLYENGIASGIASGQYGPENSIRRGDFALMVYQAFHLSSYSTGQNYFSDVSNSDYYGQAVNTLYALGIVSGTGGSSFSPQGTLSRQDAMLMVQKAMQAVGWHANDGSLSALNNYADAGRVSGYAQGAMAYMVQTGLLPTATGQLAPRDPLTRIDMAQVIHRSLTY